jgi:hypothetical protein
MNKLFDQFKKQMEKMGLDVSANNKEGDTEKARKSDLLAALERQMVSQPGPTTHADHGSFTRHASHSATLDEEKNKMKKEEDQNENNVSKPVL